jgi:hypothetical protein
MLVTLRVPNDIVPVEVENTWKQEYPTTSVLTLIILEVNKGAFVISIIPDKTGPPSS